MSLWRVKSQTESSASEWLTFAQLAERLVDGSVEESDLVQRDSHGEWISVDSIPRLLRTALQISRMKSNDSFADAEGATGVVPSCGSSSENAPEETNREGVPTESPSTSLNGQKSGFFHRRLPTGLTIGIVALIAGGAWLLNDYWTQSRRFPVPRHIMERPSEWSLPIIGRVSFWELMLLMIDAIVLLPAIGWLLWRRRKGR